MTDNKEIALVTGGGRGIGASCCEVLAHEGFRVAIQYNKSREAAEKLSTTLTDSFTIQGDIGTVEGIDNIYNVLKSEYGGQLSVLVNNAGIALDNPLFNASLEQFQKTIDVNMRGTWYITKRLSRLMIRKKKGSIINISSVVAGTGNPGQTIYGMTKAAIENFTKTAAIELAQYGILVNAVAPGFIKTDMTDSIPQEFQKAILEKIPLNRMGTAKEVAEAVRFLAVSAGYCTGSILHVNGGMYGG